MYDLEYVNTQQDLFLGDFWVERSTRSIAESVMRLLRTEYRESCQLVCALKLSDNHRSINGNMDVFQPFLSCGTVQTAWILKRRCSLP